MKYYEHLTAKNLTYFIFLGVIVFAALIVIGGFDEVYQSIQRIDGRLLLILLCLTLLNYIIRFLKWEYFLRVLDIRVPLKSSAVVFFSGLSMAITPGKVGEALKAQLLKEKEGVERRKTLVVVFAERLTDVLGLTILSLTGILSVFIHIWSLLTVLLAVSVMILVITNERAFMGICSIAGRISMLKKYVIYGEDVYLNSKKIFTIRNLGVTTLISSISWFAECFALFLLLGSLGAHVGLMESAFIFSFSSIFGSVLVLPGGLGAAEGSFVALLLLAGVSKSITSTATIVIRIATLWFGVTVGLISLFLFNYSMDAAKTSHETS